ncbi:hypothetical protein H6G51_14005 [Limnothrix sp. FACHB-708]|uniref:SPOR domain-containing protein n=1 Tax=unclassified Limnothrix TaxID=2632864 RepID=UPI001686501F|nr:MULTISPECIES: SPOR domain-containing protein [unclassified Limnothrix]MBD2554398.1 hypothetical protein [Limnothrix sp. FACHB-708]MBD2589382.1 hypothetical protein [Limnothrix sp. FACHB-406]
MQIKMAMDMEMDMEPEAVKVSQVSMDIHGDIKSAPHPTHPPKHRQRGQNQPSQHPQNPMGQSWGRWLGAMALTCCGLGAIAPVASANDTLPFGAPLPGAPAAPIPEVERPAAAPPPRSPIDVEVLEAPRPSPIANPTTTEETGWVVEEGAGSGVTMVQEPPTTSSAIAPTNPTDRNFFEPVVPSQGRYVVYALGDSLGLFEQVKQLSPTAAFVTYRGQTAVRAGLFERSIDATARVRELAQRGITAEIGELSESAASGSAASGSDATVNASVNSFNRVQPVRSPLPARSGAAGWSPTRGPNQDEPDPSALFANFEPAGRDPQWQPPSNTAPLPMAGRRLPPLGNTSRSRSLPEPPPEPMASLPDLEPIFAPAPSRLAPLPRSSNQFPSTLAAASSTATNDPAYFVVVTNGRSPLAQLINRLSELGVPASSVFPNETGGLRIGPFADQSMAQQWRSRLGAANLTTELMQNGWIIDGNNP